MRKLTLVLAALAGVAAFSGSASADPYKWCAQYSGRDGGTNCYFVTYAQCRATISGDNGGFCRRNTFYTGHNSREDMRRFN
jgi:hypothetical protein